MNSSTVLTLNQFATSSEFVEYIVWLSADILIIILISLGSICLIRDKKISRGLRHLFVVVFAGLFAWAISEVINYVFPSFRPFIELENIKPLFTVGMNDSYPSGHTAFIFGFTTMLIFFRKKSGFIFLFFALLVGVARVAAGVHWPIDIFGGMLLGVSSAFITYYFYVKQMESLSFIRKLQFWK